MTILNEDADHRCFIKGDPISDRELVELMDFYKEMYVGLRALGPHFHIAWKEVHTRLMKLESYAHAREIPYTLPF